MAASSRNRPLTRDAVFEAHDRIEQYIHRTPVLTSTTLSDLASTPQDASALKGTEYEGQTPARPRIRLFFKCENYQKVGAFKARGAFHALSRLSEEELAKGVVTHSSGKNLTLQFPFTPFLHLASIYGTRTDPTGESRLSCVVQSA